MSNNPSQFIGDIPAQYQSGLGPVLFEPFAEDLADKVELLQPLRLLELAAGTGILTRKLASRLPDCAIVATDLNGPMLDIARSNLAPAAANVRFEQADAMNLNVADESVDVVACQFGIMFFPDKVESLREARRVLRVGGTYVFSAWGGHGDNPFGAIADQLCRDWYPDDPPAFYQVPFSYPSPEQAAADCRTAGFATADARWIEIDSPVTDWVSFTKGIVFGNPLYDEILERSRHSPDEVRAEIEARMVDRFGQSPTSIPLRAYVVEARR